MYYIYIRNYIAAYYFIPPLEEIILLGVILTDLLNILVSNTSTPSIYAMS